MVELMPVRPLRSLALMMGVMRPVGVATATEMSTLPFRAAEDFLLEGGRG